MLPSPLTYGILKHCPKCEDEIGKTSLPYGHYKYVNETLLIFFSKKLTDLRTIGWLFINVFGRGKQGILMVCMPP